MNTGMTGRIDSYLLEEREILIYRPASFLCPKRVIFLFSGRELKENAEDLILPIERKIKKNQCLPFYIVSLPPLSWETDYTPWPALPIDGRESTFSGDAGKTLHFVKEKLFPFVYEVTDLSKEEALFFATGYSLGGLFVLWSALKETLFQRIGACSASVWYPDFFPYFMEKTSASCPFHELYLSLGKKEEFTKNTALSVIGNLVRAIHSHTEALLGSKKTKLVWNEGGHFNEISRRLADSMVWLARH